MNAIDLLMCAACVKLAVKFQMVASYRKQKRTDL